jgi:hypothetical protein
VQRLVSAGAKVTWGLMRFGDVAAVVLMLGAFLVGFGAIGVGLVGAVLQFTADRPGAVSGLLNSTLSVLELLFIAPLPYLAFRSVTGLVGNAILPEEAQSMAVSHASVVQVKRLITGLMIAVVATELIHHISAGTELNPLFVAAVLGLILVLSLHYWSMAENGNSPSHHE